MRLVDGISNVGTGSIAFNSGTIEAYRYEGNRLKELRTYDAYKAFELNNIQRFVYTEDN